MKNEEIFGELITNFSDAGIKKSEYKNYILWMYFLKYISDYYNIKYNEYIDTIGNESMVNLIMDNEKYKVSKNSNFDYLYNNKTNNKIGAIINDAFDQLEKDNSNLEGIFQNLDFNNKDVLGEKKKKNSLLEKLIKQTNKISFNFKDVDRKAGRDFINLIYQFAESEGKKGGQFFTPVEVSALMSNLIGFDKDGSIYDPACGSGTLLIEAYNKINNKDMSVKVYGQELDRYTYGICKMNMLLNEVENINIAAGDIFINPEFTVNKSELETFDYVLCDFEFSRKNWCDKFESPSDDLYNRFNKFVPPKSYGDYGFIMHMIKSLNPSGTIVTLIPHGVLFREKKEGKIRKELLKNNLIDVIIGLPENLLFGGSISSALLIIEKNKKNEDILFIDASSDKYYKSKGNKNVLTQEAFDKIINVKNNREEIEKFSYVANYDEIKENEYNLNIPRYVDTFEEEELIDIETVNEEILRIEYESERMKNTMQNILKNLELID